jgi:hypothetical protein
MEASKTIEGCCSDRRPARSNIKQPREMNSYREEVNGKIYRYYYDITIRLWVVLEIDSDGHQICEEADYYHNKAQLLDDYKFTFKIDSYEEPVSGTIIKEENGEVVEVVKYNIDKVETQTKEGWTVELTEAGMQKLK